MPTAFIIVACAVLLCMFKHLLYTCHANMLCVHCSLAFIMDNAVTPTYTEMTFYVLGIQCFSPVLFPLLRKKRFPNNPYYCCLVIEKFPPLLVLIRKKHCVSLSRMSPEQSYVRRLINWSISSRGKGRAFSCNFIERRD